MAREFKLSMTRMRAEPLGDGPFGGSDELWLCGLGVTRGGQRVVIDPTKVAQVARPFDTTLETPRLIKKIELASPSDTDLMFYLWCYEADNESLRAHWSEAVTTFNFWMDRTLAALAPYPYPAGEVQFQAFFGSALEMHRGVANQADRPRLGWGDGDDVQLPTLVRASHLGRDDTLASGERAYEGQVDAGFLDGRGLWHCTMTLRTAFAAADRVSRPADPVVR